MISHTSRLACASRPYEEAYGVRLEAAAELLW